MREIKFRAWDTTEKIMRNVTTINGQKVMFADDKWDWYKRERIIMQYTGLKDKNGKEIWEGDIVAWMDRTSSWYRDPATNPGKQLRDAASFRDGSFRTDKFNELLINLCGNERFNFLEKSQIEIIGNIYEHPQLAVME